MHGELSSFAAILIDGQTIDIFTTTWRHFQLNSPRRNSIETTHLHPPGKEFRVYSENRLRRTARGDRPLD
jgi:hypothetical protein